MSKPISDAHIEEASEKKAFYESQGLPIPGKQEHTVPISVSHSVSHQFWNEAWQYHSNKLFLHAFVIERSDGTCSHVTFVCFNCQSPIPLSDSVVN